MLPLLEPEPQPEPRAQPEIFSRAPAEKELLLPGAAKSNLQLPLGLALVAASLLVADLPQLLLPKACVPPQLLEVVWSAPQLRLVGAELLVTNFLVAARLLE